MDNGDEYKYQVDNKSPVQGQIIGENNQIVQNFYNRNSRRPLYTPSHGFTLKQLEYILKESNHGQYLSFGCLTFIFALIVSFISASFHLGIIMYLSYILVIVGLVFSVIARIKSDNYIEKATNGKFNDYNKLEKEIKLMRQNNL